jgi:hypothetical protein
MGRPVVEGESLLSDHSPEVKPFRFLQLLFKIIYDGNIQGVTPDSYDILGGSEYRVRPLLSVAS